MKDLTKDNFYGIKYEDGEPDLPSYGEITIRIPIDHRVDMDLLIEQIIDNIKIRRELEYRARHPIALNYASFEQWITELLVPETKEHNRNEYIAKLVNKND